MREPSRWPREAWIPLLAGVVIAGLFAAIMSTADSFLNIGAAAIVHDIPRALRGRSLKRELLWARTATVGLAAVAALFALYSGEELVALLSDPRSEDPVGSAEWTELKQLLVLAIGNLPEPEKTVITLYYGEELLLKEIGEVLGVTESRVSQIHSGALYRLNRELKRARSHP